VTRYGYDKAGHLTSETDPLDRITRRAWDKAGNLITIIDPAGHEQHMSYDADGRLTEWSADDAFTVSFSYDKAGRRTSMTDATGTTHYSYDSVGNLLSVTGPDGEAVTASYDAAGQRTSLSYPGGLTVGYGYDLNGRLTSLTDSRAGTAAYALDPDGRLITEQLPGGLARRYHYEAGLLRRFLVIRADHLVASATFTHDPDGRIASQRDDDGPREFRYDRAGQLVYAGRPGDELHLVYDAAGNRVLMRHGDTQTRYAYDAADQLTGQETDGRRVEFRYDSSGRLTEQTELAEGERRRAIRYNGFGWPVEVVLSGRDRRDGERDHRDDREVVSTTFDGDGLPAIVVLRTARGNDRTAGRDDRAAGRDERAGRDEEERAALVRYRWSTVDQIPQVLTQRASPELDDAERDRPGHLDADFAYGYGRTFASSPPAAAAFHHDAYLSAIRTPETADWVQASRYGVFGTPAREEDERAPELPRFGYRGELALGPAINLRARVYDSELGRFTSRDPLLSDSPVPGQDANPYLYAGNDPVNFTDPLGTLIVAPTGLTAVTARVPAAPPVSNATNVATGAVSAQAASGGDRTSLHNACTYVGAGVLAAQLAVQHGIPTRVQFELVIAGAPKRLMKQFPNIPSASQSRGRADLAITYATIGLTRVYIWETKSVASPAVLSVQARIANLEAEWYSTVFNQRAAEQMLSEFAEPGVPMAISAFLPLPPGFPGASGVYEVFSKPGVFGAILYQSFTDKIPPGVPVYEYQPEAKKVRQVSGPQPSPIGISAQKVALGAAGVVLIAGAAAGTVAAAADVGEILADIGEALLLAF